MSRKNALRKKARIKRILLLKNIFLSILLLLYSTLIISFIAILQTPSDYIYADFLKNRMSFECGVGIVGGMLLVLFGAFLFQKKRDVLPIEAIIIWFVGSLIVVSFTCGYMLIHNADIKNEDFLVYTGEFETDYRYIILNDEKATHLTNTTPFWDTGSCSGRIIYSKRTKYVLSYSLENGERASVVDDTTDNFQSPP